MIQESIDLDDHFHSVIQALWSFESESKRRLESPWISAEHLTGPWRSARPLWRRTNTKWIRSQKAAYLPLSCTRTGDAGKSGRMGRMGRMGTNIGTTWNHWPRFNACDIWWLGPGEGAFLRWSWFSVSTSKGWPRQQGSIPFRSVKQHSSSIPSLWAPENLSHFIDLYCIFPVCRLTW